jgi:LysM repeat protein
LQRGTRHADADAESRGTVDAHPNSNLGSDFGARISGTGTPGSKVRIIVDGEVVGTATVGENGRWSYPITIDDPGKHEIVLEALDVDGNVVATTEAVSLNVAPGFAPLEVDDPELGEFLSVDGEQATGQLALSGKGEPGATVQIWAGDRLLGTTTVRSDGSWTFDQEVVLPVGVQELSVRMQDADGNELAASEPVTIEIEAQPAVATPTLNVELTDGEVTMSGTGTPGSRLQIVVDGQVVDTITVGEDGQWSYTAVLDPGDYELSARAVDGDGNILVETEPTAWTQPEIEIAAPTLTSPALDGTLLAGVVKLSGSGQPGAEVEILVDDVVVGTAIVGEDGTWAFEYAFGAGTHALAVRNAGDSASTSQAVQVSVVGTADTGACEVLPGRASECPGDPPNGIDQGDTYVVAQCEYMGLIAQRTGVQLVDLLTANPQVACPHLIYPGQVLSLPPRN